MSRDQTDTFDRRGYKSDNKDLPPVKDAFIAEPLGIAQQGEPRIDSAFGMQRNDVEDQRLNHERIYPIPVPKSLINKDNDDSEGPESELSNKIEQPEVGQGDIDGDDNDDEEDGEDEEDDDEEGNEEEEEEKSNLVD